jgi:hypothetical protein
MHILDPLTVLDHSFLTNEECLAIKEKILSMKELWQEHDKISSFNFLPFGMYSVSNITQYTECVAVYRETMNNVFGTYYSRLIECLEQSLGVHILDNTRLHYPGFHISTMKGMQNANFHMDGFPYLLNLVDRSKFDFRSKLTCKHNEIISIIVPIELPEDGGGLLFKTNEIINQIDYCIGTLLAWKGNVLHSAKPFKPNGTNDLRITMQGHLVMLNKTDAHLFW